MLDNLSDDAGAAGGGVRDVGCAVRVFDDGGGDGGEGAFEGFDEVGFGWDVAECVRDTGDAEVCCTIDEFE